MSKNLWNKMTSKVLRFNFYILVVFSLFQGCEVKDQKSPEKVNKAQLEIPQVISSLVEEYNDRNVFEGAVLVAQSDSIIFEKAYGLSNRQSNEYFTVDTVMPVASLTKPITSSLILMLVEQGKLSLSQSVSDFFPEFENDITIHHLLSHTSGIPSHFLIEGWFSPEFHQNTSDDEFVTIISSLPLRFTPGTDLEYSNLGYFL
ncbi:serine hydrolase domain-containing protein, partial [Paraglaciecola sp.]